MRDLPQELFGSVVPEWGGRFVGRGGGGTSAVASRVEGSSLVVGSRAEGSDQWLVLGRWGGALAQCLVLELRGQIGGWL